MEVPETMNQLELHGVSKTYGDTTALDDVDLEVESGELHLLAGPNGSGKTTLTDVVLDRVQPTGGDVGVAGTVGCGFQEPRVFDDLQVKENLRLFDADEETTEALRLHRVLDRTTRELSDGYRKKLDLAAAFADDPDLLVLDEPLADLDDVSRRSLVELVRGHVADGGAALVATHRLEEFTSADRLTVLLDGEVVASLSAEDVSADDAEGESVGFHDAYLDAVERTP